MFYFKYSSRYSEDISIICAFDKTTSELTLEIGLELTNKLSSIRDINPEAWTLNLENYVDTVIRKSGKDFKIAALVEIPDELFRSYCEKVLLDL